MAHSDGRHHAGNGHAVCRKTADVAGDILEGIRSTGGATVSVGFGEVPTEGYVVAVPGHELRVPFYGEAVRAVTEYVERKRATVAGARITRPSFYGAWKDGDDIVLDVVEILPNREDTIAAGKARGELAIWDIVAGEEIRVDVAVHNADDDEFKALPYPACLQCRGPLAYADDDVCPACAGSKG